MANATDSGETEQRARRALAKMVGRTLRVGTTIQLAAIGAREEGLSRAGWLGAAAQIWDALDGAWAETEKSMAGSLEAPRPAPTDDPLAVDPERNVHAAIRKLVDHADSCELCRRGVLEHIAGCPGCAPVEGTKSSEVRLGKHLTGSGGCDRYRELAAERDEAFEDLAARAAIPGG